MAEQRSLGIDHGRGSNVPQDGSCEGGPGNPAWSLACRYPDGHNWESEPFSGYDADAAGGRGSLNSQVYQEWFSKLPDDLFTSPYELYHSLYNWDGFDCLIVTPDMPDRTIPLRKTWGPKYYNSFGEETPPIQHFLLLEGNPPYFEPNPRYIERFTVCIGEYRYVRYTAKPVEIHIKDYRLATNWYHRHSFQGNDQLDTIWGEATLLENVKIGGKTYIMGGYLQRAIFDQMIAAFQAPFGHVLAAKFKGTFKDVALNACWVEGDYDNCQLFDMNTLEGTMPRYHIKGGIVRGTVIAMNWGNLDFKDATDSHIRLDRQDLMINAKLTATTISSEGNDKVVGPIGSGELIKCVLNAGTYQCANIHSLSTVFKDMCNITVNQLKTTGCQLKGMAISGSDFTLIGGVTLDHADINSLGKAVVRHTSLQNSQLILGDKTVIEYSNIDAAVLSTQENCVIVSSSLVQGTVAIEDNVQLDGCWVSSNVTVVVKAGTILVNKDLSLKSVWLPADGDPGHETSYTPVDQVGGTGGRYGIHTKEIDFSGCILTQSQYDALQASTQSAFTLFEPDVFDYGHLIIEGGTNAEYTLETEILWKATDLTDDQRQDIEDQGIEVCKPTKWYWPMPMPYSSTTVIDPRT